MPKIGVLQGLIVRLETSKLGELMVRKGLITRDDLGVALKTHQQTRQPIGQILVEKSFVSQRQLRHVLFKQHTLRYTATALVFCLSFSGFSAKRAHAERIKDVPAKVQLANISAEFSKVNAYPAIMGTSETRSRDLSAFTKWTGMFNRFDRELNRADSIALIRDWQSDLYDIKGGSVKAMARDVNDLVNKTRYIVDSKNWGKSDYWATPIEFLTRGGDCEDFAIAKYTALRALGVPEERLRVAIVQDTHKNIPHAVLIVYAEDGAYVLDNQIKKMISAESGTRYKPIFSINRQAWWLHKAPSRTILASAD